MTTSETEFYHLARLGGFIVIKTNPESHICDYVMIDTDGKCYLVEIKETKSDRVYFSSSWNMIQKAWLLKHSVEYNVPVIYAVKFLKGNKSKWVFKLINTLGAGVDYCD
ncbi:MAG: hypothetical protein PHW96_03860 [Candidatus Nanoarchaeia archaeon]|nr:hypothetical protein [Candidatus Nanoarchaeia archaeon]